MANELPTKDDPIVVSVRLFSYFAYGLIFVIVAGSLTLAYVSETFRSMFHFGAYPTEVFFAISRLALVVMTLLLLILWISSTANELDLWSRYMKIAAVTQTGRLAMGVAAIALAVLLLLTYDILLFSGYFAVFMLITFWCQWVSNNYFSAALKKTRISQEGNAAILDALEDYWLKRPQFARIATIMFVSLVTFALALYGRLGPAEQRKPIEAAAYVTALLILQLGK